MKVFSWMSKKRIGDYVLLEKLAEGALSSIIYKARHITKGYGVVLKILTKKASRDLKKVESIFTQASREGVVVLNLNHKNIARIYDCGQTWGRFYYAMEYVDGDSLEALLATHDPWVEAHRIEIISGIINGVEYLHDRGILHRDICPRNVMVSREASEVKIIDLGLAIPVDSKFTEYLWQAGTASYMAPEHIKFKTIDTRTDIYSLGVTMYRILTGHLPFLWHDDARERMHQHLKYEPFPLTAYDPAILPDVEKVVLKALEKEPCNRYRSVRQLREAFKSVEGRWRDTRKSVRHGIALQAACRIPEIDAAGNETGKIVQCEAVIHDISESGARLEISAEVLPLVRECYFKRRDMVVMIVLPGAAGPVQIRSKVCWLKFHNSATRESTVTLNLYFVEFCENAKKVIAAFLRSLEQPE